MVCTNKGKLCRRTHVSDALAYTAEFLNRSLVPFGYTHVRNVSNGIFCILYNPPVQAVWFLCPYKAQITLHKYWTEWNIPNAKQV
jgi:hypothetical protein